MVTENTAFLFYSFFPLPSYLVGVGLVGIVLLDELERLRVDLGAVRLLLGRRVHLVEGDLKKKRVRNRERETIASDASDLRAPNLKVFKGHFVLGLAVRHGRHGQRERQHTRNLHPHGEETPAKRRRGERSTKRKEPAHNA